MIEAFKYVGWVVCSLTSVEISDRLFGDWYWWTLVVLIVIWKIRHRKETENGLPYDKVYTRNIHFKDPYGNGL